MKKLICTAILAVGSMAFLASADAETINAGLVSAQPASYVNNVNTVVSGTIDSAYIVGVFGNSAYLEDSTGAVYGYNVDKSTSPLYGLPVGTLVTGIGASGTGQTTFVYEAKYNDYEFTPLNAGASLAITGSTPGGTSAALSSELTIPTFYNLSQFNSVSYSGTYNAVGLQNTLMTFDNVSVLSTSSTVAGALTTWTSGATYIISDGVNTGTVYISASETGSGISDGSDGVNGSGIIGAAIPAEFDVTGLLYEYQPNNAELDPRFTTDIVAAPEPSTWIMALGGVGMLVGFQRSRRRRP